MDTDCLPAKKQDAMLKIKDIAATFGILIMAIEIEVKILNVVPLEIMERLERAGAQSMGEWFVETRVFDFPDRRLLSAGGYVRIRNEGTQWHCTYKKKISQDQAKTMLEMDMQVSDPQTACEIFKALGLEIVLCFEKKRRHYEYEDWVFDLDELPGVPPYLEIEASSWEEIERALDFLGIDRSRGVSMGPKELLAHYGMSIDEIQELRFKSP